MNYTNTPDAPAAIGPYSQAISANGFLFASGQVPLMPGTGEIVGTTIEEQAERACQSIKAILAANGLGFEDVIKTTCFLANMEDFAAFNGVYGKYFTEKPARSCVAVKTLPKGVKVEVTEEHVSVNMALNLKYGYSIPDVCEKVQEKVKNAIENMTGLTVLDVNIKIAGVSMEEK